MVCLRVFIFLFIVGFGFIGFKSRVELIVFFRYVMDCFIYSINFNLFFVCFIILWCEYV